MTIQQLRMLLRISSLVFGLGAVAVVVWGLTSKAPRPRDPASQVPTFKRRPRDVALSASWEELSSVCRVSLQQPLYDPPPPVAKSDENKESKKKRRPERPTVSTELRLVGTLREEGKWQAIFLDPQGKIDLKGPGETVELPEGRARIGQIETDRVMLSIQNRSLTLKLLGTETP